QDGDTVAVPDPERPGEGAGDGVRLLEERGEPDPPAPVDDERLLVPPPGGQRCDLPQRAHPVLVDPGGDAIDLFGRHLEGPSGAREPLLDLTAGRHSRSFPRPVGQWSNAESGSTVT